MRALVTGSSGFIGRHMVARLEKGGFQVFTLDTKKGRHEDCRIFFRDYQGPAFDLVVHCAAIVGGREMIDGMPMAVANDLAIDSDFFQFVARGKAEKAVYYSSSAAYPIDLQWMMHGQGHRLIETDISLQAPELPDAVYGWVKLTGEQVARYARKSMGLPIYIFRPFSGYGADQDPTYPFPSFIDRTLRKVKQFEVWGPGTQVRDWIHVEDVISLTLAALDSDPDTYNLCTGQPTSMIDAIKLCLSLADHEAEIIPRLDKPVGVEYRVGDPTKMLRLLGTPKWTLEEGIGDALDRG